MDRWHKLIPLAALVVGAQLHAVGPASARPIEKGRFSEPFSLVHENFCGVPGLTVSDIGTAEGRFLVNSRGRDRLPYGLDHVKERNVVTNLANGKYVVWDDVTSGHDLRVIDNHDGTSSVLFFATGNTVVYGSDGRVLGRNPGQGRAWLLIDNADTPLDPSDDSPLGILSVVKQSTGRTDDLCAAMLSGLV
jgi:hypothetical protein